MNPTVSFAILSLESWVLSQEKTMTTFHTGANMSLCLQIPYRKRIRSYFKLYLTWAPDHRSNRALNIQWPKSLCHWALTFPFNATLCPLLERGHTLPLLWARKEKLAFHPSVLHALPSACVFSHLLGTCLIISGLNKSGVWRDILWTQHIPPDVTPLSPPKMWQWRVSIKANGSFTKRKSLTHENSCSTVTQNLSFKDNFTTIMA